MELRELVETRFLPFIQQLADNCLKEAGLLRFDKTNPHHLYTVCVYGTIVEITYGCLALVEKRQSTMLPTLLRSLLEAYADFRGCLEDSEYFKSMHALFLKQKWRLVSKAAANSANAYLKGIVMSVDLPAEKSALEAEINKLKEQGHGPLDVSDRFSKSGLGNQYQSEYWVLCLHTHNNISALEDQTLA